MLVKTPNGLHYPITVTELLCKPGDDVTRSAPLFSYLYTSEGIDLNWLGEEQIVEKEYSTTFESEVEGTVKKWKIRKGEELEEPGIPLIEIEEPCKHEVQFGGMCAICGKDMTEVTYVSQAADTDRAQINIAHTNTALKISEDEANRWEDESKRRLLQSRKLSLVVDLDQTIIHATVDPTVAEWQKDQSNPNHDAVKDVRAFQLTDEAPGARGCWYYIKLRPGLKEFFENIGKLYECHIYTMGTRAYAENIAKIVDPDRKIFGERILSRDESGSMTAKSLQRLFPVDTKMVVIIDDRGDVWKWTDNLVKVTAYDFFVGIGDINSSFLPKRPELDTKDAKRPAGKHHGAKPNGEQEETTPASTPEDAAEGATESQDPKASPTPPVANGNIAVSVQEALAEMSSGENTELLQEQSNNQEEALAAQMAERPLLKMQEKLEALEEEAAKADDDSDTPGEATPDFEKPHHSILHDDDVQLKYLEECLGNIHKRFYDAYDEAYAEALGQAKATPLDNRVAQLKGHKALKKKPADEGKVKDRTALEVVPDVKTLMGIMRSGVLEECSIVFSGIVPLGYDIQQSDIATWAKSFGAEVQEKITKTTTHVVATPKRRTAKVKQAAHHPHIKIVTVHWLLDSIMQWKALDEKPYLIHVETDEPAPKTELPEAPPPFEEPEEGTVLSESESEAAITEDETKDQETGPALTLDIPADGEVQHEQAEQSPMWDQINDELAEFLGSDADDTDTDLDNHDEDNTGTVSDGNESATDSAGEAEPRTNGASRKRKRNLESEPNSDASDSDASTRGSKLQRRKKKAYARTSSLTNMTTAPQSSGLPSPDTTGPDEGGRDAAVEEDGYDSDGLDSALEAELEAELLQDEQEAKDGGLEQHETDKGGAVEMEEVTTAA